MKRYLFLLVLLAIGLVSYGWVGSGDTAYLQNLDKIRCSAQILDEIK
jgi:hypothetical protein